MDEVPQLDMGDNPLFMMPSMNSGNKENILGYIGGYIVKKLQKIIDCNVCYNAMLSSNKYYFNFSLVTQKDRGGLVYPSTDIVKILNIAERVLSHLILVQIIGIRVFHPASTSDKDMFTELFYHDLDYHNDISEDFHSTQIQKNGIKEFLNLRLFRYGQEYSKCVNEKLYWKTTAA